MAILELERLKGKSIKIVMIESEYTIDWTLDDKDTVKVPIASQQYKNTIQMLVEKYRPDLVAEELGLRNKNEVNTKGTLAKLFKRISIPYITVDIPITDKIPDYIKNHLINFNSILGLLKSLEKEINKKSKIHKEDEVFNNLILWYYYLKGQKDEYEEKIRTSIRESWFIKEILEKVKEIKTRDLVVFLIANSYHFSGLRKEFEKLNVKYEIIKIEKTCKRTKDLSMEVIKASLPQIEIKLTKKKKRYNHILYFFDTDPMTSPFDINMAYDVGFNVVYPISNIQAEIAGKIASDLIFSRGPEGLAYTTIMIDGSELIKTLKIVSAVKKVIFPPFQVPIVIDPKGAYTTAAAAIIKAMSALSDKEEELNSKKVAILGTGAVGKVSAVLTAEIGCNVLFVETRPKSAGFCLRSAVNAVKVCKELNKDVKIIPAYAPDEIRKKRLLADREVIFTFGAAGIELISKNLRHFLNCELYVDINAVPPHGVDGLKPTWDKQRFKDQRDVWGIGSLPIAILKHDIRSNLLLRAKNIRESFIYSYKDSFLLGMEVGLGILPDISGKFSKLEIGEISV